MERLQAAIEKARAQRRADGPKHDRPARAASPAPGDPEALEAAWMAIPELALHPARLRRNRILAFENGPAAAPYDILRTRFIHQAQSNNWRRVAVVSPHSSCGKTTVTANLAFGLARQGEISSVVLDFDLRQGRLGQALRQKNNRLSLVEVLEDRRPFSDIARRYGRNLIFGLNFGAARQSTEVLQAKSTRTVLERIEATYMPSFMVFDMPPLSASDDNLAFLTQVDAALIVVEAERTTMAQVDVAERQVAELTNVMGVVLNKSRFVSGAYGYEAGYY